MGAKCCMPVRDDMAMILRKEYRGPNELYTRRNNRCSPSWSFRCDNRTHIEDIVDNPAGVSCGNGDNGALTFRNVGGIETEGLSDGSNSSDSFQRPNWQKLRSEFSVSGNSQIGSADLSTVSISSHEETKIESSSTAITSDPKLYSSMTHTNPSSSRVCSQSSRFSRQISEGRVSSLDSLNEESNQPFTLSFCSNDLSTRESHFGSSSDNWSMRPFSDLILSSQRDIRTCTKPSSSSISSDVQICRVCSKTLSMLIPWGYEPSLVAVLVCGHAYHAECLENVTPEAFKFDPACPTCFHGESSNGKSLVKAASVGSKIRNKVSRRAVADVDVRNFIIKREKNGSHALKNLSGKSSFGRSFLRRYLPIGSQSIMLSLEGESSKKKRGFWVRHR